MLHLIILIGGILLLVKGSDFFVETSSRIAKKLGVSELFIGLTLVAIGTSIPEFATSIIASINNHSDIIIGNIIGTNVANITLIIGLTALISGISTTKNMLNRDGYIMVFAALILLILLILGEITFFTGIVLLSLYFAYLLFLLKIKSKPEIKGYHFKQFINYYIKMDFLTTMSIWPKKAKPIPKKGMLKESFILLMSITAIIIGARLLVNEAVYFAELWGLSKNLIGISIVAIGTSLPELSVTLTAARKGLGSMVLGNIMGSNIANVFLVLGTAAIINPISITAISPIIEAMILLGISFLLLIFIKSEWKIHRYEGIVFILLYISFLLMVIFSTF